jgi:hypothetical protein
MIIRVYWTQCNYHKLQSGNESMDSFWVEATYEEATTGIFPFLKTEAIAKSTTYAQDGEILASQIGNQSRPYCFLVAQDLSMIEPLKKYVG